jgi:hypothetical protein
MRQDKSPRFDRNPRLSINSASILSAVALSIKDNAPLVTDSPISFALATVILLSIPSFLATSSIRIGGMVMIG